MFTSFDKLLAAIITPVVVYAVSNYLPAEFADNKEFVLAIAGGLTALAVYFVPNKVKEAIK